MLHHSTSAEIAGVMPISVTSAVGRGASARCCIACETYITAHRAACSLATRAAADVVVGARAKLVLPTAAGAARQRGCYATQAIDGVALPQAAR